jgi:hypothetical protein
MPAGLFMILSSSFTAGLLGGLQGTHRLEGGFLSSSSSILVYSPSRGRLLVGLNESVRRGAFRIDSGLLRVRSSFTSSYYFVEVYQLQQHAGGKRKIGPETFQFTVRYLRLIYPLKLD